MDSRSEPRVPRTVRLLPLGIPFKVPSEPTLRWTLPSIDREAFDAVYNAWLTEEFQRHDNAIAVDGKAVRGSGHGRRKRPVQWLAALGHATGQVLGPVDVDSKTNAIPKIKDW
ncbi:MAG: hypothetical protein M1415_05655, partial [Firmicutes bacterium]|nr:hypothetical protein [Bacillota bacterium]